MGGWAGRGVGGRDDTGGGGGTRLRGKGRGRGCGEEEMGEKE